MKGLSQFAHIQVEIIDHLVVLEMVEEEVSLTALIIHVLTYLIEVGEKVVSNGASVSVCTLCANL